MSLRSRIRGGQAYLTDRGATAAQFLTLRLFPIGSTHMGCDDSDGPGHAPRYLYVRQMNHNITRRLWAIMLVGLITCVWSLFTRNPYPFYLDQTEPGMLYYSRPLIDFGYPLVAFTKAVGVWSWGISLSGFLIDLLSVVIVTELLLWLKRSMKVITFWTTVVAVPIIAHMILIAHAYLMLVSPVSYDGSRNGNSNSYYIGIVYECGIIGPKGLFAYSAVAFYIQVIILSSILCLGILYKTRHLSNESLKVSA